MSIRQVASEDLSTANSYTGALSLRAGQYFTVTVSGVFSGTVTCQRSFDGALWHDLENAIETPASKDGLAAENCLIRAGFKPGNYGSGTATVRLGTGG